MIKWPYCAKEIQEGKKVCGLCHSDLRVAPPYSKPIEAETSGKAIASLIFGIIMIFPAFILAIVLGHIARAD